MNFSFEPNNIIKTVKRTVQITIAGFVLAIATVAAPATPKLTNLSIPDPLEQVIANASPSARTPNLQIGDIKISRTVTPVMRRSEMLEYSLSKHGQSRLTEDALILWKELLPKNARIPFSKVFVQFDDLSESFFFAYDFKSGQRLEATTYIDDEDDDVYFSVFSENRLFFQNVLARDAFFRKASEIWRQFEENNG